MPDSSDCYLVWLGSPLAKPIPSVISPAAHYVAPDSASSLVALGINGFIKQYNDLISQVNIKLDASIVAQQKAYRNTSAQAECDAAMQAGRDVVIQFNSLLASSRANVYASCTQLKLPLPRQGTSDGVSYLICDGVVPTG